MAVVTAVEGIAELLIVQHVTKAYGSGAKQFSPIHPVMNGMSESQKRRCRFAHNTLPLTRSTACSM